MSESVDTYGNVGTADSFTWTVDLTGPTATITDAKVPSVGGTSISDGATTGFDSIAFTYESSDADFDHFECSLDSSNDVDFTTCPNDGRSYTGLSEGEHTFYVRAVDTYGNVGTADSFTWTVDLTGPTATITDAKVPSVGGTSISDGATTGFDSIAFTYESSDADFDHFECSLDSSNDVDFTTCPNDVRSYTGLSEGEYTFYVRVVDTYGNVGTADSFTWTVDLTGPTATITDAKVPSVGGTSISDGATTGFDSIAFTYESSDADFESL